MTAATIEFFSRKTGRADSLEDEILAAGLPVIDTFQVEQHVKDKSRLFRYTPLLRVLGFTGLVFEWLRLAYPMRLLAPNLDMILQATLGLALSVLLFAFGLLTMTFFNSGDGLVNLLLTVPFCAWVITLLFGFATEFERPDIYRAATYRWSLFTVGGFLAEVDFVPPRIQERIRRAAEIPGARVRILADTDADPFLVVIRGFGPFREKVYVGAWDTGTSMDEV